MQGVTTMNNILDKNEYFISDMKHIKSSKYQNNVCTKITFNNNSIDIVESVINYFAQFKTIQTDDDIILKMKGMCSTTYNNFAKPETNAKLLIIVLLLQLHHIRFLCNVFPDLFPTTFPLLLQTRGFPLAFNSFL